MSSAVAYMIRRKILLIARMLALWMIGALLPLVINA